jgi:hypothetical protein
LIVDNIFILVVQNYFYSLEEINDALNELDMKFMNKSLEEVPELSQI